MDVQVSILDSTDAQSTEVTAPAPKKRRTEKPIDLAPNANAIASTSSHDPAGAPTNTTAFSTSSIASVPPSSSASPSKPTSPATITSSILLISSIPVPLTAPAAAASPSLPVAPQVRVLSPATGVLRSAPASDKEVSRTTPLNRFTPPVHSSPKSQAEIEKIVKSSTKSLRASIQKYIRDNPQFPTWPQTPAPDEMGRHIAHLKLPTLHFHRFFSTAWVTQLMIYS